MRVLGAGSVLVLVLVLAACGGSGGGADGGGGGDATDDPAAAVTDAVSDPTQDTGGSTAGGGTGTGFGTHPCDLLDQSAVETATGVSGMAPTAVPIDATSGLCGYQSAGSAAEVVLSVWDGDAATAMWASLDYLAGLGAKGIERVDGLGADAIFSPGDGTLVVTRSGTAVQVAVRLPERDADAIRSIALDLGRQVVDRL